MSKRWDGQFKVEIQQNGICIIYKKFNCVGDSIWTIHSTSSTESIAISLVDHMYQEYLDSRVVKIVE